MKHPDQWYTSKQISEKLVVSIGSVTMSLKKLRKTNIIKFRNTGKRNTFQYMVQSEPAKIAERKTPMLEQQMHTPEATKLKVKIKPKIVHQHTYLGGQTFYGVIRPKEEVDAMERMREDPGMHAESEFSSEDDSPKPKRVTKTVKRRSTKLRKRLTRHVRKKTKTVRKLVKKAKPKSVKKRSRR